MGDSKERKQTKDRQGSAWGTERIRTKEVQQRIKNKGRIKEERREQGICFHLRS